MTSRQRGRVVDVHAHILLADVVEKAGAHNVFSGFGARPVQPPAGSRMAEVFDRMLDPARHLPDMDEKGVDYEVLLSTTVIQGSSWASPEQDLALNAQMNDEISVWVQKHPNRFVGSCTVPLQDLSLAVPELERCVRSLGARVVQVPAHTLDVHRVDPAAAAAGTADRQVARRGRGRGRHRRADGVTDGP